MALSPQPVKWGRLAGPPIRKIALMPTLFRLLTVLAIIGGIAYGVIWALANYLEPAPRSITITVPQDRIGK